MDRSLSAQKGWFLQIGMLIWLWVKTCQNNKLYLYSIMFNGVLVSFQPFLGGFSGFERFEWSLC